MALDQPFRLAMVTWRAIGGSIRGHTILLKIWTGMDTTMPCRTARTLSGFNSTRRPATKVWPGVPVGHARRLHLRRDVLLPIIRQDRNWLHRRIRSGRHAPGANCLLAADPDVVHTVND